jgi:hypothetical protein
MVDVHTDNKPHVFLGSLDSTNNDFKQLLLPLRAIVIQSSKLNLSGLISAYFCWQQILIEYVSVLQNQIIFLIFLKVWVVIWITVVSRLANLHRAIFINPKVLRKYSFQIFLKETHECQDRRYFEQCLGLIFKVR